MAGLVWSGPGSQCLSLSLPELVLVGCIGTTVSLLPWDDMALTGLVR